MDLDIDIPIENSAHFFEERFNSYAEFKNCLNESIALQQPDFLHCEVVCCLIYGRMLKLLKEDIVNNFCFHFFKKGVFLEKKKPESNFYIPDTFY